MSDAAARPPIVAIDGPSGVGKSTAARLLAQQLGVPRLDTGAMYRAAALKVLRAGVDPDDRPAALAIAAEAEIEVRGGNDGRLEVLLDGEPVEPHIRTPQVSDATSRLSTYPEVRQRLVRLQRRFAQRSGAVVEGRDIGTVVFPDTPFKFFLDANPEVRAERRFLQLSEGGQDLSRERVRQELARRDARDAGREASPMAYDSSYVQVDTSSLDPDAVVQFMLRAMVEKGLASPFSQPQASCGPLAG